MKQGSITSFIKKKADSDLNASQHSDMKNASKPSITKLSQTENRQITPKKIEIQTNTMSTTQENLNSDSRKKRRHILDEDEAEVEKTESLAEVILIPTKESKLEKDAPAEISNISKIPISNSVSIPFATIVAALTKIENTKGEGSKDTMKEVLANLFNEILINSPEDLSRVYYFLLSKVGPEYKSPELGIGTGILEKVVAKAIGKSDKHIKEKMVELGDLALVAMEGKKTLGTMEKFQGFVANTKKDLTLKQVMDIFVELANIKGKSSQAEKEKLLVKLLFNANRDEVKYIIRSLQKGLKIGASLKTIVAALARTISRIYTTASTNLSSSKNKSNLSNSSILEEKEAESIILISMNQLCDEDVVFSNLIEVVTCKKNFSELILKCKITPGVPVKPQLARPTTGLKVIFQRFEGVPFTCEYKYDGFRGQVHHFLIEGNKNVYKTEIFSRNLENMTASYPDIVEYVEKIHSDKVSSFILDCEIVAFDSKNGKILPFHQLTTRARKNVNVKDISINVCMFVFDILYLNTEVIIEKTLEERRNILKDNFEETEKIQIAKSVSSDKFEEIEGFMNEAIAAGCEGLIIKALQKNSSYQPGQRNFNWLKLKKDYLDTSIGDSLDLVPIGAEYGKGRRKGFYGSYLLACWDEEMEKFQTVTMTGAGLKDEDLENLYKELSQYIIKEPRLDYDVGNLTVDVWFDAKMVWEIKTADLSISPIYTAAKNLNSENRGISLRFPRFIRVRPDKKPEEATNSEEILKMYRDQESLNKKINFAEEEFYD